MGGRRSRGRDSADPPRSAEPAPGLDLMTLPSQPKLNPRAQRPSHWASQAPRYRECLKPQSRGPMSRISPSVWCLWTCESALYLTNTSGCGEVGGSQACGSLIRVLKGLEQPFSSFLVHADRLLHRIIANTT